MSVFDGFNLEHCTWIDDHGMRWVNEGLSEIDFLRTRFTLRRSHPPAHAYLQQHPTEFLWGSFCLAHGKVSTAQRYRIVRDRVNAGGFREEGQCYRNSMRILYSWKRKRPDWVAGKKVSYVEGLAVSPMGVFLHGWIDIEGMAYDMTYLPTWMTTYFGVHFEPAWADKTMEQINKYGMFPWWERSKPILEKAFPIA